MEWLIFLLFIAVVWGFTQLNDNKKKELELKEKELTLKRKELWSNPEYRKREEDMEMGKRGLFEILMTEWGNAQEEAKTEKEKEEVNTKYQDQLIELVRD